MEDQMLNLRIQNSRLRIQNEELWNLVNKDFSIRDNGIWIHMARVREAIEVSEDLDDFREWFEDVQKHLDEAMRV